MSQNQPNTDTQTESDETAPIRNLSLIGFGILWMGAWLVVVRINFIEGHSLGILFSGMFALLGVFTSLWGLIRLTNTDPFTVIRQTPLPGTS